MSPKKPTYQELEARLAEAEAINTALRNQEVDAIVSREHIFLVRLKEMEEALKKSEQRYRQLFEGINDAVMVYSSQGKFLDCNEVTLQRYGYSREEFLRLGSADIVHPDFHLLMKDNQNKIWAGESIVGESAHRDENGKVIPVEINARRIEYQGKPAILAVVRDITERKRMEEELKARFKELELFTEAAVGREERMAELKREIRELKAELEKYRT